jgi:hypothetical protein
LSFYGFVPGLRADGERAFFESAEALVAADIDGRRDVYEWEQAGVGSCPATREDGCVYLISSGRSARGDYLYGHSQSGDDVFIFSADILVKGDGNTLSVYDARVGGGFAEPLPDICIQPDECRQPAPPPVLPVPHSRVGPPGNVEPQKKPKKCPKGKRKVKRGGKVVCVKKKQAKKRKAKKTRRAAR